MTGFRRDKDVGAGYFYDGGNGSRLTANASYAWSAQDRIEYFNQNFFDSDMVEVPHKQSSILNLSFTWRFRNYLERNDQPRERGIGGEIDGLF